MIVSRLAMQRPSARETEFETVTSPLSTVKVSSGEANQQSLRMSGAHPWRIYSSPRSNHDVQVQLINGFCHGLLLYLAHIV